MLKMGSVLGATSIKSAVLEVSEANVFQLCSILNGKICDQFMYLVRSQQVDYFARPHSVFKSGGCRRIAARVSGACDCSMSYDALS